MQTKYTLTKFESSSIREAFEDIPVDLCEFVDCPECPDGADFPCESCPMHEINSKWEAMHNQIHKEFMPLLQAIEE